MFDEAVTMSVSLLRGRVQPLRTPVTRSWLFSDKSIGLMSSPLSFALMQGALKRTRITEAGAQSRTLTTPLEFIPITLSLVCPCRGVKQTSPCRSRSSPSEQCLVNLIRYPSCAAWFHVNTVLGIRRTMGSLIDQLN